MPGKIFLSCGQATEEEQRVAKEIKQWLENSGQGFQVYVAIEAQSINDLNNEIILNLESSDYFIFVDFRREKVVKPHGIETYRGSLFTNQELAMAYWLRFEKTIFFQQEGIELEGMSRYILSNAERFTEVHELLPMVKEQVKRREWTPSYSRHLLVKSIERSTQAIHYSDHTGNFHQWVWFASIENKREHVPATNTVARLTKIINPVVWDACPDRGLLKWAGQMGYQRLIMPNESEPFSAFAINVNDPLQIYLHSAADLVPRSPINERIPGSYGMFLEGEYSLHYQVISERFPLLEFDVKLTLTGDINTTEAHLIQKK